MAAGKAGALVSFDFEQKYFVEFGPEVKDHCIIRVDGVYHIFYLRGNPAKTIGHATSPDLTHWTIEEPLLSTTPGAWDERAMWAPHVIESSGSYFMYYTGVNLAWSQQAGLAISDDLFNWYKVPTNPVYHPDPAWALWAPNTWSHGRDPFVFEHGGTYYMLNTAKTWTNYGAVACATSTDLINWQDAGPFYVNDTWHVFESVHLENYNNRYQLFFTEETVLGTSYMASDSLLSGWDTANRILLDAGGGPEVNEFDPGHYIFSRHTVYIGAGGAIQYTIKIDTLKWVGENNDEPIVWSPWALRGDWNYVSGTAFIYAPTFLNNPEVRGEDIDPNFEGLCWLSSYESYTGPLQLGNPGDIQGDAATGVIRSRTFTIEGKSMNLLVGGGDYPDECYVALVDAQTQEVLCKETGRDSDVMDRRYWDLKPYAGREAYIEIADVSTAPFGHISCDDIRESTTEVSSGGGSSGGSGRQDPSDYVAALGDPGSPALLQNVPNPFNPQTSIRFVLPSAARATITVYDARGRQVRQLLDDRLPAGTHDVRWDGKTSAGSAVPSGVYFCRLSVDGRVADTRKMVLLK